MSIFKRKDSRPNLGDSRSDKVALRPAVTVDRLSEFSFKSPKLIDSNSPVPNMVMTIPDIPIAGPPDPTTHPAAYLRSIHAVRERASLVLDEAKVNALHHFDVDLTKFDDAANYVVAIIRVRNAS